MKKFIAANPEAIGDVEKAGVSRVTSVVGEISASAQEQSSGISQVNDAVSELDRMTQQNAAQPAHAPRMGPQRSVRRRPVGL